MKVICLRCARPQENHTAPLENPEVFYIGCKSCGFPYARYAPEKK